MAALPWPRLLPLVLFVALGVFLALNLGRPQQATIPSALVGKPAPALALPAYDARGGLATDDFTREGPVLVNFFASWCLPCRVEAPQLEALKQAGVTIHGIAHRDAPDDIRAFLLRHGDPFTRIGMDADGQAAIAFGSAGLPETFLIDREGIVRFQHQGEIRAEHVPGLLREVAKWR